MAPPKKSKIASEEEYSKAFPLPDPYASNRRFAVEFLETLFLSLIIGLIALVFNCATAWAQHQWWPHDYPDDPTVSTVGGGEYFWLYVTTGAGFLVGLLSHFLLPHPHKGFFLQLQLADVEFVEAPGIFIVSLISLAGGCSLGPECALAFAGGGLSAWYARYRRKDEDSRAQTVLSGMVAAIGAVFPSPVLSVMLMIEMNERKDNWDYRGKYMRSIALFTVASTAAFTLYYGFLSEVLESKINTFLSPITITGPARLALGLSDGYIWTDCLVGFLIGIASGIIGTFTFTLIGLFKKNFERLGQFLRRTGMRPVFARIIPSTIAGVLIGLMSVALPLTMGSGAEQLPALIRGSLLAREHFTAEFGGELPDWLTNIPGFEGLNSSHPEFTTEEWNDAFSPGALLLTALGKMVTFGLARGGGFVGGLIFPLIFIGACFGMAASALIPNLPWLLSFTCFLAAVPCSIMPAPISAMGIAAFTLSIGTYATAPIFVAAVTAHVFTLGLNVLQTIVPTRLPPGDVIIEYERRRKGAIQDGLLGAAVRSPDFTVRSSALGEYAAVPTFGDGRPGADEFLGERESSLASSPLQNDNVAYSLDSSSEFPPALAVLPVTINSLNSRSKE